MSIFFINQSGATMPDLQTKQTYSLMTLILVAAGTAAVVVYASNNVRAARNIIG